MVDRDMIISYSVYRIKKKENKHELKTPQIIINENIDHSSWLSTIAHRKCKMYDQLCTSNNNNKTLKKEKNREKEREGENKQWWLLVKNPVVRETIGQNENILLKWAQYFGNKNLIETTFGKSSW